MYRLVEVNRQIPPDLYKAVAEILIFVYNSKKQKHEKMRAQIEEMKKNQEKNDREYYKKDNPNDENRVN